MWVAQNTPELQAPMLSGSEEEQSTRRPFEFLTSIFKRRREHECETETEDEATSVTTTPTTATATTTRHPDTAFQSSDDGQNWAHDDMVSPPRWPPVATGMEASVTSLEDGGVGAVLGAVHHTPVKSRDIGIDMEAIRLSRQDNPYLQRVAESQTTLTEEEEAAEDVGGSQQEDRAHLVTQASQEGALSLSEVHEHLIRSPPPTTLPRTLPKSVFVFPVNKGVEGTNAHSEVATGPATVSGGVTPAAAAAAATTILPNSGRPSQGLKPVVTRQHEDVLDHNLRQILHTQRQLVVARGRPGEGGGGGGASSCSSVPASPAHSRALTRRSPHARTQSEEASVAQNIGGTCEASPGGGLFVGGGGGMSVSAPGMGTASTGGGSLSGLAPVYPPGRRQYSSTDLLLNPANAPIGSSTPTTATPTPTPPVLKPIASKSKKGGGGGPEGGSSSSSSLRLPIRYPHQPAASSPLVDIT